jgi:hypothetical protein
LSSTLLVSTLHSSCELPSLPNKTLEISNDFRSSSDSHGLTVHCPITFVAAVFLIYTLPLEILCAILWVSIFSRSVLKIFNVRASAIPSTSSHHHPLLFNAVGNDAEISLVVVEYPVAHKSNEFPTSQ